MNELFPVQGDPIFWHHSSFRHSSALWTESCSFWVTSIYHSTGSRAVSVPAQLLDPLLTTHLVPHPWVPCPWLCKNTCMKERAVPCCLEPAHSAARHKMPNTVLPQSFFFISLIKSTPLSLLDAFVITSSLASAYTTGFSLHLKCREFKHYV